MSWRCPQCGQVQATDGSQGDLRGVCRSCGYERLQGAAGSERPVGGPRPSTETAFDLLDLESLENSELVSLPTPPPPASTGSIRAKPSRGRPADHPQPPPFELGPPSVPDGPAGRTTPLSEQAPVDLTGVEASAGPPAGLIDREPLAKASVSGGDSFEVQAAEALQPPAPVAADALEILDDEALFRSLDVEGFEPSSVGNSGTDVETGGQAAGGSNAYSMVSVRCRVCDTLQYVETRPGLANLCDICFTPLPVPGSEAAKALESRRASNVSDGPAKVLSPEAIGAVAADSGGQGDEEVAALILNVEGATGAAYVTPAVGGGEGTAGPNPTTAAAADQPPDDDLKLAPLESEDHRSLDLLLLEDETKQLLQPAVKPLLDADEGDLVPLEDDESSSAVLEAVLDEAVAVIATDRPEPRLNASPPASPPPLAIPPAFEPAGARPVGGPAPSPGLVQGRSTPVAVGPASPSVRQSTNVAPGPLAFSGRGPSGTMASGSSPAGPDEPNAALRPWWQDLAAPFLSPALVGGGLLLIPLVYWWQISWRLAWDEGTFWQQMIGFFSTVVASLILVPLWLAFLGVIANRQLGWGQAGRLSLPAIGWQMAQFAILLGLALPGAALGTPATNSLVSGCLAAFTMLPLGLYFVTSAIAAEEWFCYHDPGVVRSLRRSGADWAFAFVVVGLLLTLGIPLAIITSYGAWLGAVVFAIYAVGGSMVYAALIGRLAWLAQTQTETDSQD